MACYDTGDYSCTYDSGDVGAGCGGGGCDYTVLATWESATDNDLDATGLTRLKCYDSQNHDNGCTISGASNTSGTVYRVISSSSACSTPFAGKAGSGANFTYTGASQSPFWISGEAYTRIEQLCVKITVDSAFARFAIYPAGVGNKVIDVVIFDGTNVGAGRAEGSLTSFDGVLFYNCIVYGFGDHGIRLQVGAGETAGIVCCTAINNGNDGFAVIDVAGTNIAWSCYGADNTGGDFSTNWDAPSGWCASKDATADNTHADNNKENIDLTDTEMDADYLALESISWSGAADDRAGRTPVDDVSGSWDPDSFFTGPDALFAFSIEGNARPAGTDVAWDVGASEFVAAGGLSIPTDIDGLLQRAGVLTTTNIDALLMKSFPITVSIDALLGYLRTTTTNIDGLLKYVGRTKTISIDALLKSLNITTYMSIDSILEKEGILITSNLDAILVTSGTFQTFSIDSVLKRVGATFSCNIDASLQKVFYSGTSIDGLLQKSILQSVIMDALLLATNTSTVDIDSLLQTSRSSIMSTDSLLQQSSSISTLIDALLQIPRTGDFVLDSILVYLRTVSTSIDAILQDAFVTYTASINIDALLQISRTITNLVDAVLITGAAYPRYKFISKDRGVGFTSDQRLRSFISKKKDRTFN